jgi:hypothetical protein
MSSGTILKPNYQIDSLTSVGTIVTVQTKEQHNIQPGTQITIIGAREVGYNGTFTVTNITGFNTFQYTATSAPTSTTASGLLYVSVVSWENAVNRLGMFDQQNGVFFEFDGSQIYAVRRNSTFQILLKSGRRYESQTRVRLNLLRRLITKNACCLKEAYACLRLIQSNYRNCSYCSFIIM